MTDTELDVAFVTGAGGGLGTPIVRRLAADGYHVVAADIDAGAAARAVDGLPAATAVGLDVADTAAVRLAVDEAAAIGPLTVAVNNAAVFPSGPFVDVTEADYDAAHAVNQRGYFFVAQAAVRHMVALGRGSVVNLGSITEHGSWPAIVAYATAKGAAGAFTRALATELGPIGIRVNCVAPGAFPTPAEDMQPAGYEAAIYAGQALQRRGELHEIADAVAFLCSEQAAFITGHTLTVDGGWKMR